MTLSFNTFLDGVRWDIVGGIYGPLRCFWCAVKLPNGELEWVVEETLPPLRLDHYLKYRLSRFSRTELQNFVDSGGVHRLEHNGQRLLLKNASRVHPGDVLRLRAPTPPPLDPNSEPRARLEVIYEDEVLMVVDKPAGMLVHPAGLRADNTVIGILRDRYRDVMLDLAHRLDRETSGLLLLTRTLAATRRVKEDFKHRRVKKRYQCVVKGNPDWTEHLVDLPMTDGEGEIRIRQSVRADGYPSRTLFRKIRSIGTQHALLEAHPETGRLHQIRVHLEACGFPLVGDKIYGTDGQDFLSFRETGLTPELTERFGHWRHALHASHLTFSHPQTGSVMEFHAPLAGDLLELLKTLEQR